MYEMRDIIEQVQRLYFVALFKFDQYWLFVGCLAAVHHTQSMLDSTGRVVLVLDGVWVVEADWGGLGVLDVAVGWWWWWVEELVGDLVGVRIGDGRLLLNIWVLFRGCCLLELNPWR
jgi:hypothetical protein